jgi:ADP-ribosyl-[dinitrogen reductase] hydrolase
MADPPTPAQIEHALTLPGGGALKLKPGQFTDDGELTLTLLDAMGGTANFNLDKIATAYTNWLMSGPPDVGITTRAAFRSSGKSTTPANDMIARAKQNDPVGRGESNGALMRCTPLAQFVETSPHFIALEASLTHPGNNVIVSCNLIYLTAINSAGDLEKVKKYVATSPNLHEKVVGWFYDGISHSFQRDPTFTPHGRSCGHVRYAFTLAMHHLAAHTPNFLDAMRHVLSFGGDTDTNCAIVGGLVSTWAPPPEELVRKLYYRGSASPEPHAK